MNIIQLQNMLRGAPDQSLIDYVQNPQGQVPSYLVLSELQRRKDTREKYQAQQAPESSVAEDLAQPAQFQRGLAMLADQPQMQMEDQGVAGLDTGDMYQEDSFAGGGIVAFEDGGPVATSRFSDFFSRLRSTNLAKQAINRQINALISEKARLKYDYLTPLTPEQKTAQEQTIPQIDKMIADLEAQKKTIDSSPTVEKPRLAPPGLASLNTESSVRFTNEDIANMEPYRKAAMPRMDIMPTKSTEDITKPMLGPAVAPKDAGINSLLEDTEGLAEKRMERYRKMVGEDPERAKLEALTKKYETGAVEQERMAPWMALAKAGFTMAGGKSPFAIQNLSEGAVAGLADYAQAKDRLDKLTERQIDIKTKMQQAKRAEDIAAATYGLNSEAAVEARNAQVKLKDMEEKNAFARTKYSADVSTKNAMIAAARKSDFETFLSLAEKDEDNYKTVKDKDGTVRKVFDVNKATQTYRSFGPSGSTDKEFLEQYERLSMLDKDFKKKYPTAADYILDQRAKLSGSAAPSASASSSQWGPLKVK